MTTLQDFLQAAAADESVPGAAALVAHGDDVGAAAVGDVEVDSIAPVASITKPITAAAVMLLVDEGRVALDDPIARWLPELASPVVVRTPESPVDDVVPASRPVTVEDLLSFRAGWGFPSDFSLPAVGELFEKVPVFGVPETPDEWLVTLSRVPMLRQPGEAWLYNTCSDIQGVLIARAAGQALPEFLAERFFEPLGMTDTGFFVQAAKLDRMPPRHGNEELPIDEKVGVDPPVFPSGAGGLVSTVADWHRFGRMLLAGGGGILSPESVRLMTTDHLTPEQRDASTLFLEGAGWGYGGSVRTDGRYGWVGGTGTTAHIVPATGTVGVLITQVQMTGPASTPFMQRFWQYAFGTP
jgi:CubicO group peptidase (beta-lactamase class C family)